MEHGYSFNKQLRKAITARAVLNKRFKMLEIVEDKNNFKKDEISQEINGTKKSIRRRQKNREIIGFQQRDRQDSQKLNNDTFCRLPVVSSQCIIGTENILIVVYF